MMATEMECSSPKSEGSASFPVPVPVPVAKAGYDKLTPNQLKSLSSSRERVIVYHQSAHDSQDRMVIDERINKQLACAFSPLFARSLSKTVKGGSITITGGRRTGLQQIFQWIQGCGERRKVLPFPQYAFHPYTQALTVRDAAVALEMEPIVNEMTARLPMILEHGIHSEDVLATYVSGQDPAARMYATQHIAALAVEGMLPAFNVWDTLCQTNEAFQIDLETCLLSLGTNFAQLREIANQRRQGKMHRYHVQTSHNTYLDRGVVGAENEHANILVQDQAPQTNKNIQSPTQPPSQASQQVGPPVYPSSGDGYVYGRGRGRGRRRGYGRDRGNSTGRVQGYRYGQGQEQGQNKGHAHQTRNHNFHLSHDPNRSNNEPPAELVRLEIRKKHGKKFVQPSLSELGIKKSMFLTDAALADRRPPLKKQPEPVSEPASTDADAKQPGDAEQDKAAAAAAEEPCEKVNKPKMVPGMEAKSSRKHRAAQRKHKSNPKDKSKDNGKDKNKDKGKAISTDV